MALGTRMQQRRATEAAWTTSDYVLAAGELGVATDTGIIKIGNGVTPWSGLDPAFDSQYLPILGTAANASLLEGISSSGFVKVADATTAATADKVVLRLSDGRAKAATGTATDDVTNKSQMDAAITASYNTAFTEIKKEIVGRTVTSAATLALGDLNAMIFVNHASLTAQVVVTIPTNATVGFAVGSWIDVCASGAGGVKLTPASGVSLVGNSNVFPNYGIIRLIKLATDLWIGVSMQHQKRLPKIRAVRTGGTSYAAGSPTCVPWNTIDSTTDFYNPDNEWFSVPGTGLSTARRIIINKDGEYLVAANFITTVTTAGSFIIAKMVNDNTLTGSTYLCNVPIFATVGVMVRARFAAGETVGAAYQPPTGGASDQADNTFGNRNDFIITRLTD